MKKDTDVSSTAKFVAAVVMGIPDWLRNACTHLPGLGNVLSPSVISDDPEGPRLIS